MQNRKTSRIIIVMGVSGSGKTRIGQAIAEALNYEFQDADWFHPELNKAKMKKAIPLTDSDRLPWLLKLRCLIEKSIKRKTSMILSCSALKESYRQILAQKGEPVRFLYLKITPEAVRLRLNKREHEFMNKTLIESQFDILEEPRQAMIIEAESSFEQVLKDALQVLSAKSICGT